MDPTQRAEMATCALRTLSRASRLLGIVPVVAVLLLGASAVVGCSSSSDPAGAESGAGAVASTPVLLTPMSPWPSEREPSVTSIDLPEDAGQWPVIFHGGLETREVDDEAGGQRRRLHIPGAKKVFFVTVPHEFESGTYQKARIYLRTTGFVRVGLMVGRGTAWRTLTPMSESDSLSDGGVIEVDLAAFAPLDRSFTEFMLVFGLLSHNTVIDRIELLSVPLAGLLDDPTTGESHFSVEGDSRRSTALLSGAGLAGSFRAPRADGASLTFQGTVPTVAGQAARVDVKVLNGSDVLTAAEVELSRDAWSSHEVSLEAALEGVDAGAELRVEFTLNSGAAAVIGCTCVAPAVTPWNADHVDTVVLITSDTHRGDFMGYSGEVETPFLDALSARGTRFTDVRSVTSITNPSHSSILTGLTPRDTRVLGNLVLLSERADTLAERFRAQGYRTLASVSAVHLIPSRSGLGQGFDEFSGPSVDLTRDGSESIAKALDMLERHSSEPIFIWLHLFDVHAPYRPHDEMVDLYYEGDPYSEELPPLPPKAQAAWDRRIRDAQYIRAMYRAEVSYLDGLVKGFFAKVPRLEEALVGFTADHGECLGDQGTYWSHSALYPATLEVPLFLLGPGVAAGEVRGERVSNRFLAHTLLELSGVGADEFPGHSILDSKRLRRGAKEPEFFIGPNGMSASIEFQNWYLLLRIDRFGWGRSELPRHAIELYDRDKDPEFANNVAEQNVAIAAQLRARLIAWLSVPPPGGGLAGEAPSAAGAAADIAALGYVANANSTVADALIDPECGCAECVRWRKEQ